MFDLVEKHELSPERTRSCASSLGKTAFDMHGGFANYKGKFEALLSTHYAAAAILHDRELSLAQFEPARYNDPNAGTVRGGSGGGECPIRPWSALRRWWKRKPSTARPLPSAATTPGARRKIRSRAPDVEEKFRTYAKAGFLTPVSKRSSASSPGWRSSDRRAN